MGHEAWLPRLRESALFAALDEGQLQRVMGGMQQRILEKGEGLFQQGQPAGNFFLLLSGQVKLFRLSPEGGEKVIEIIRPGQSFAEALMFIEGAGRYPVNAEAVADSEVLAFDSAAYKGVLRESVDSCFSVMAAISRRLHGCINEIDNLSLRNAAYRVVIYLLQQLPDHPAELETIHLPASKGLIASRLSIQPETFSRVLKRLSAQGLIDVLNNDIVLKDLPGLRQLTDICDEHDGVPSR